MKFQTVFCGMFLLTFAGMMCAPTKKGFLEFACGENINCPGKTDPVCGSDDRTYDNKCELALENQYRYCQLGDFNRIAIVHEGNCSNTGS
ncbi:hypothetical protein ACF0H5_017882 [Mactra antiquata]